MTRPERLPTSAPQRLVLFDIDGTLLSPGPAARSVLARALEDVFGTRADVETYAFEGKLDPAIVTELMRGKLIDEETIARRRGDALRVYLDRLEEALALEKPSLKPGVVPLLKEISAESDVVNALLTGNVERGARIKLEAAGLWHHFAFGVFGDEASCREELGPLAIARAETLTGRRFGGDECVVVGDSRQDVACGLAIGARVVAVATGKTPEEDLRRAGATVVLRDFSDLRRAREAILG
jgi:phosphoglycolate phosphatase